MSLSVKQLNGDTSFLLTFTAADAASSDAPGDHPRSLTVLTDPWLTGPSTILSPKFAITKHTVAPCISSLAELPDPDFIIISQDKPDHCNEETLRQLSPKSRTIILAPPKAAKKIRSWRHFNPRCVCRLKKYDRRKGDTIFRAAVPASSPIGVPGEFTVAFIPTKLDLSGLHTAIGITYRSSSELQGGDRTFHPFALPTPPDSPLSPRSMLAPSLYASQQNYRDPRVISIIYSPHGVSYETIRSYAHSHLVAEAALPLSLLLHCFDHVQNTWYFGGNISSGSVKGVEIARNLSARTWIGAHDEEKDNKGISVLQIKTTKFDIDEIRRMTEEQPFVTKSGPAPTHVVNLDVGEELSVPAG